MFLQLPDLSATLRRFQLQASLAGVLILASGGAMAQSLAGLGALTGSVRDSSGAAISGADVELMNKSLGIDRHLKSTSDGLYLFPSLNPGEGYVVIITAAGFGVVKTTPLTVHVGEQLAVPITVSVSASDTVTVSDATAPIVDTSKTEISSLVNQTQIMNLPINGRRVDQFSLLSPGVVQDGTTGEVSFHGVPSGNAFLQDGVDITNQWFVQNAGGSAVLSNISQDAVAEFRIETAGYSAEFGRGAGGVVNTITKSGTNMVHGTAFWFFRNRTLNATDLFSKRTVNGVNVAYNPPEFRHQFGGTVGGPIISNKLFAFGSYEGTIRNFPLQSTLLASSTTILDTNGQIVPGICTATAIQCAGLQTYLNKFHNATVSRSQNQNAGLVRFDYHASDKSTWTANTNILNFSGPHNGVSSAAVTNGSGTSGVNYNVNTHIRNGHLSNTYLVSSRMVNEFRFGFNADRRAQGLPVDILPSTSITSALSVSQGGLANLARSNNAIPNIQPSEKRFTLDDTYSVTMGKHLIKAGASLAYLRSYENGVFNGPGAYAYNTLTDLARDLTQDPTDASAGKHYATFAQAIGHPITRITIRDWDFFAQDQWQVTQKFLINAGVRYEYATYTQPPAPSFAATVAGVGKINQPTLNFAPRIGLSYAANTKTVIRANYGIFYNRLPGASVTRLQQLGGIVRKSLSGVLPTASFAPTFPGTLNDAALVNVPAGNVNTGFAKSDLATPYVQEAQLGVEQALTKDISVNISYVWARGLKFLQRSDLNAGAPSGTQTYTVTGQNGSVFPLTIPVYLASAKKYAQYGQILQIDNAGRIWYDGLLIEVHQRQNRYLQSSLSYTWSHAEDLTQGAASNNYYFSDVTNTLFNGAFPVNGRSGYSYEKGRSAEDQRHRLVLSAIANIPTNVFGNTWKRQALTGWQVAPIFTWATPQYVNSTLSFNSTGAAGTLYQTGNITGIGGEAPGNLRVPFLPLSNLPLGETVQLDARLTKKFPVKEGQTIELSFEAINALNHIRYTSVNQVGYTANYAAKTITPNSTAFPSGYGRGTASGGFPDGTNARRAQASVRYVF